jgi:hypothetical protein
MEKSAELERAIGPHLKEMAGAAVWVPSSAFNTRAVSAGGSGSAFIGTKVQQMLGVLGWSAVVRSGATMLGPLTDSNLRLFHDSNLPVASWTAENAVVTPADVSFASSTLSPRPRLLSVSNYSNKRAAYPHSAKPAPG